MEYGVPIRVGADLRVCPDTLGEHEYILGEHTGSPLRKRPNPVNHASGNREYTPFYME
jgi:hypothetical protein